MGGGGNGSDAADRHLETCVSIIVVLAMVAVFECSGKRLWR
jgi:hypothetical protein